MMNRIRFGTILGALLLGLFMPLAQSLAKSDAAAELRNAQALLAKGEYDKAFDEYRRFAEEKNNPLAQFTLGLFFQNGWGRPVAIRPGRPAGTKRLRRWGTIYPFVRWRSCI
jgi:TPR repeat protein